MKSMFLAAAALLLTATLAACAEGGGGAVTNAPAATTAPTPATPAATVAAASTLPPAPIPEYKVGDEFVFGVATVEDTQRVISVSGTEAVFESRIFGTMNQPKAFTIPAKWTGSNLALPNEATITEGDLSTIFPLQVGKTSEARGRGLFGGNRLDVYIRCEVVSVQNIAVPAGRFDTFLVDCNYRHANGDIRYVYWYAPQVGHWVRVIRGNSAAHELKSYKRA